MKDVNLKALADGLRGSDGKVTIPLHQSKKLGLKTIEVLKNGASRVNCGELVAAIEAINTSPKETPKPAATKKAGK